AIVSTAIVSTAVHSILIAWLKARTNRRAIPALNLIPAHITRSFLTHNELL
ncbi:MAG: hypothetical protein ACI97K_001626, partial [Glaciecola sp.]